jgi:hypothetical protein
MGIPPESATVEIDLAEKHDHQQGRAYLLPSTDDPRGHRPSSIRAATGLPYRSRHAAITTAHCIRCSSRPQPGEQAERAHCRRERQRDRGDADDRYGRGPGVRRRAIGPDRAPASVEAVAQRSGRSAFPRERLGVGSERTGGRVVCRGAAGQAAAGAVVCRQSLSRLCAALVMRHSDLAADLPRRRKRSMPRLNLVSAKTGSIIVWRLA